MASYPTYNPSVWVGGISTADYQAITSKKNNYPTLSRAYQGLYAPGSTFKIVSVPAVAESPGFSLHGTYDCPPSFPIGSTNKKNFESESFPPMSLQMALEVSCDTVFYKVAYADWLHEDGVHAKVSARDPFTEMAKAYGMNELTGVDLTGESRSRIFDRQGKYDYWKAIRADACAGAKTRKHTDPVWAIDVENCSPQGYIYQAGEAANFAIGQGATAVTPLQMARAYAAVANGGTLWEPTIGKAIMSPAGKVVRTITPKKAGTLPVPKTVLAYLQHALTTVVTGKHGTARTPFADFPKTKIPMAAKTGTAEVNGKQSTSWFASYAPANKPQYAIVMMVSQGGTGSGISGPSVEKIYEALYGVTSPTTVNAAKALMPDPPTTLPRISRQGRLPKVCALPLIKSWIPNLANIPGERLFISTAPDRGTKTPSAASNACPSAATAGSKKSSTAKPKTSTSRASPSRSP
jgi:penicillin-binding protein 2